MKLLKLTATFGCLDHDSLEFGPGMTLIGAPNGSGKSTWCAFLRTMLYGLDTRQRDRKGVPADKNRYRPWGGKPMEGLMVCLHEGRILEIRRTSRSGAPMGDFSAVDRETGQPVPGMTAENAGETLTGVSREVFDRSVFLRQTGLAISQSQELEKRIASLVSSGEEDVSWSEADERLRAWQRRRRYRQTGLLPELEAEETALRRKRTETAALRQELAQAQNKAAPLRRQMARWERLRNQGDDPDSLHQRYREAETELDEAEERVRVLQNQLDKLELMDAESREEEERAIQDDLRSRSRLLGGFVFVVILLTIAAAAVYILPRYPLPFVPEALTDIPLLPLFLSAGIAGGLWLLVLLLALFKSIADHRDRKALDRLHTQWNSEQSNYERLSRDLDAALTQREHARRYFDALRRQGGPYLPPEAETCRTALAQAEAEVARLQGQLQALGDPAVLDARLDEIRERTAKLQDDYDALEIAIETLGQADAQLQARFSPQLSQRAGVYFHQLTGGRYDTVILTRTLEIAIRETGELLDQPLSMVSQGTADQLYLALRLAVADLVLPSPDAAPLILDDALLTFDDRRLELALHCLTELAKDRQVILFTCQHREPDRLAEQENVTLLQMDGF